MAKALEIIDRRSIPSTATESSWKAEDGWEIRRIDWAGRGGAKQARGSILFLPGRGDHYEKYLETLDYYAAAGWNVTSTDWRGQGLSGRYLDDPHVGHIDDFSTWIADIRYFYSKWEAEQPGPHVVIAHSMGGHLAMRTAAEGAIHPDALILSAPMLCIHTAGLPLSVNHAFARFMVWLGRGERPAWKVSEKPLSAMSLRAKILTHDPDRYADELAWWEKRPGVKLGPASWHWIERAIASIRSLEGAGKLENMKIPTLLMATTADQLVSTRRIIADEKRLPHSEILLFGKEAAHELLREVDEVRDKCLDAMNRFMDEHAPKK
ncbi:alpha/beta fold hydrolase [Sphingorhabdus arenilitoris]|uniref:Alpha/beta fold hydrolase n=1 Tax=Sphingorhabdus arenilitoris TaxID=1490041 RepID=A0ABV8REE8_9SPHN